MARYFLEVAYKGTRYSGFQVQENANTVQAEVEKAFQTIHRKVVHLTGSSRTDAGVHALQNFFHFDFNEGVHSQAVYKMNAILPNDIVIKEIYRMPFEAHCRFDALSRKYTYNVHKIKNPFLTETSFFYPYQLDVDAMQEAAEFIKSQENFFSFSKTNTQIKNFNCTISQSEWSAEDGKLIYTIGANRFLRGMVRLITATFLKIGRKNYSLNELQELFSSGKKCGYSIPAHGLCLQKVTYPENYFFATARHFKEF